MKRKKTYDKNISPVGWYYASYIIRFIELEDENNDELGERFYAWKNTVIVKAGNLDEAYDKVVKIGKSKEKPYKGGLEGVPVQWVFEGVTELLPVYEKLEDGAEIAWTEYKPRKLKNLRNMVRNRDEFSQ